MFNWLKEKMNYWGNRLTTDPDRIYTIYELSNGYADQAVLTAYNMAKATESEIVFEGPAYGAVTLKYQVEFKYRAYVSPDGKVWVSALRGEDNSDEERSKIYDAAE